MLNALAACGAGLSFGIAPEVIARGMTEGAKAHRTVGVYAELKHPTYFAGVGLPMEDRFLKVLGAHEYTSRAPIEIQSFEVENLKYLRTKLGHPKNVRLMQLVGEGAQRPADLVAAGETTTFGEITSVAGMREIARYADVVAPPTRSIIPLQKDGRLGAPTSFVADAHAAGLLVHIWTFRPENLFLAADFKNGGAPTDRNLFMAADFRSGAPSERNPAGSVAEMRRYIEAGIDGFFSDDPALGRQAIDGV